MASPTKFSECFDVYWKIKNFSFCCNRIQSPAFTFFGDRYCLQLCPEPVDIVCILQAYEIYDRNLTREISFLTCDGSPVESISGEKGTFLLVSKDVIFGKRRNSFLPEDSLTVQIRSPTDSERRKFFIYSQIGVERKYFLWNVKSFSNCQFNLEKSVENSKHHGDIKLTLKSVGEHDTNKIFYIEISRTGGERCSYSLKVSVLNADGKPLKEESDEFVLEKEDVQQTRMFPAFFKMSEFLARKNLLLPEDTLSLKCSFAMSLGKLDVISYYDDVTPLLEDSEDLSLASKENKDCASVTDLQTDLKSTLENETLSDVILQINSEVIGAHKTILSTRSPVFKKMFTRDMEEAINSKVVVEDLDVETVRRLLLYMYTDTIGDYDWENMRRLYYAADKYEVMSLQSKCLSFLKVNLSVSNVCEALALASLHQEEALKTAAIDFVSKYDSAVFASEAWKEFEKSHSPVALEVLREICCNKRIRDLNCASVFQSS